MIKIKNQSIIVLTIFLVCTLKYYLISILNVIPQYGSSSRLISWLVVLPLTLIGIILSISVIIGSLKNIKERFVYLIIIMPFILYFVYFFIWM
jgi:hypothetical protein